MHPDWQSFLSTQGAVSTDGAVIGYGDSAVPVNATVLCDLSHQGLILASGDDAKAFLHGQLTNDVQALTDGQVQLNGYCSPKGRLLATFLMWPAKQGYLLQLPGELVESVRKRLSMYVLRSKVKLEDVTEQWVRFGVAGPQAESLLQAHFGATPGRVMSSWHGTGVRVLRLAADRFEIVASPDVAITAWQAMAPACVTAGRNAWDWLDIHAGWPTVVAATQDAFVPQMVNYELIDGVNFKKGCYPGQEIVARTQYRGILKRRMVLASVKDANAPRPGDPVFSPAFGDQAAGQIVNVATAPDGGFAMLVVAQLEAIRNSSLHVESCAGPALVPQPLPYPIPQVDHEESQQA